jgi:hypothetical protein
MVAGDLVPGPLGPEDISSHDILKDNKHKGFLLSFFFFVALGSFF